jgi:hypothetical protein
MVCCCQALSLVPQDSAVSGSNQVMTDHDVRQFEAYIAQEAAADETAMSLPASLFDDPL